MPPANEHNGADKPGSKEPVGTSSSERRRDTWSQEALPIPFSVDPVTHKLSQPLLERADDSETFCWSDGRHQCSHDKNSEPANGEDPRSTCAALAYIDSMYCDPQTSFIICPDHHCVLLADFEEFQQHIAKHHKLAKKMLKKSKISLETIHSHVMTSYSPQPIKTLGELADFIANNTLLAPIQGLSSPKLSLQCPQCLHWFHCSDYWWKRCLYQHYYKGTARESTAACVAWAAEQPEGYDLYSGPRLYTQQLFLAGDRAGLRMVLPSDYTPAGTIEPPTPALASSSHRHPDLTITSPKYLVEHGWTPYVETLDANPSTFVELVAVPSRRTQAMWDRGTQGYMIEEGLMAFYRLFGLYMEDGNNRMNSCDDVVRENLVTG